MGLFSSVGGALGTFFLGPGGGAAGAAIGGAIDGNADKNATNDANNFNRATSEEEYRRQKEFAQMGIRWKADDARAAGLHPMAVLGSQGSSYSPTIVTHERGPSRDYSSVENAISSMGQNIGRAQMATKTETERQMEVLALERAQLQNRLLEGQVQNEWASLMGQPSTPPMPAAAGLRVAPVGAIRVNPSQVTSADPQNRALEAGSTPVGKSYDLGGGLRVALPSQQASESLESMGPLSAPLAMTIAGARRWYHGPETAPSPNPPDGYVWKWSPWKQSFSLERASAPRHPIHTRGSYRNR